MGRNLSVVSLLIGLLIGTTEKVKEVIVRIECADGRMLESV
jgi:hypothetical protein